ncbi:MAG: DUF333 domain-containing protein [Candidatus Aenigmarchaeota archaeon]|nr:DUF333 domain-containing protein [Candidatus Aenigmarchaeota archaeon]
MKLLYGLLVIITLFILILLINQQTNYEKLLSYSISGCFEKTEREYEKTKNIDNVFTEIRNNSIYFIHKLNYVCCAKIKVYLEPFEKNSNYTIIKIKEVNEGEMCRCVCDYEINGSIGPLENGNYLLQIYGVEFQNVPGEIIFEKEININKIIGVPNPASKYCIENNGSLFIEKDKNNGEYGVCIFQNNAKCEEWAFFKGECSKEKPNFCISKEDCACGTHINTGECFVGSKEFVNIEKQCPDYCTGIAGNFKIDCINHQCKLVKAYH